MIVHKLISSSHRILSPDFSGIKIAISTFSISIIVFANNSFTLVMHLSFSASIFLHVCKNILRIILENFYQQLVIWRGFKYFMYFSSHQDKLRKQPFHLTALHLPNKAAPRKTGIFELFIKPWDEFSIFIAGHALMCLQKRQQN